MWHCYFTTVQILFLFCIAAMLAVSLTVMLLSKNAKKSWNHFADFKNILTAVNQRCLLIALLCC